MPRVDLAEKFLESKQYAKTHTTLSDILKVVQAPTNDAGCCTSPYATSFFWQVWRLSSLIQSLTFCLHFSLSIPLPPSLRSPLSILFLPPSILSFSPSPPPLLPPSLPVRFSLSSPSFPSLSPCLFLPPSMSLSPPFPPSLLLFLLFLPPPLPPPLPSLFYSLPLFLFALLWTYGEIRLLKLC